LNKVPIFDSELLRVSVVISKNTEVRITGEAANITMKRRARIDETYSVFVANESYTEIKHI